MRVLGRLLLAASLLGASGARADACGNAITATDENVQRVAALEAKLAEGAYADAADAAKKLLRSTPLDYQVTPNSKNKHDVLTNRTVRIFALASARLGGTVGPWGTTDKEKRLNVEHAQKLLEALASAKEATPGAKSDYGEALARTNGAKAKELLEKLAAKDVITSPQAWAALAGLRGAADPKGRDAAIAKCKGMAGKNAAALCGAEGKK